MRQFAAILGTSACLLVAQNAMAKPGLGSKPPTVERGAAEVPAKWTVDLFRAPVVNGKLPKGCMAGQLVYQRSTGQSRLALCVYKHSPGACTKTVKETNPGCAASKQACETEGGTAVPASYPIAGCPLYGKVNCQFPYEKCVKWKDVVTQEWATIWTDAKK